MICDPFRQSIKRIFNGGIGIVSMLFRCNIMAIVGGGKNPEYSPNKVMVWDDHSQQSIGELVFFLFECLKYMFVDKFYSSALKNGATDEGKPGIREDGNYYGYIRDIDGNKISARCLVK